MKSKRIGFIVFEFCDDFEQALSLDAGKDKPPGGVLDWRGGSQDATAFLTRKMAKDAITRTEHYRLAFGTKHPEAKHCKIVPLSEP